MLEEAITQLQNLSGTGGYRYRQVDGLFTALLSEAYLTAGDHEHAWDLASKALAATRAGAWSVAVGYAERAVGRIALASGKLDEAELTLRRALETFVSVDARCQVARAHMALADVSMARGKSDQARTELKIADDIVRQMQAPRLVERIGRVANELGLSLD